MPLLQLGDLGAFLAAKKVANAKDGRIPWSTYYDKLLQARRIFRIVHISEKDINTPSSAAREHQEREGRREELLGRRLSQKCMRELDCMTKELKPIVEGTTLKCPFCGTVVFPNPVSAKAAKRSSAKRQIDQAKLFAKHLATAHPEHKSE